MKPYLFTIVTATILLSGCNQREKTQNARETVTIPQSIDTSFFEHVSEYRLIRLEATHTSALLGDISKIRICKEEIFAADILSDKLAVFGKDGKFLRTIGRMGRGPGEYVALTDFEIDYSKDEVLLLDKSEDKILVYGTDGTFKKQVSFESPGLKVARLGNGNFVSVYGVGLLHKNDYYALAIYDPQGRLLSRHVKNELHLPAALYANTIIPMSDGSVCFMPQFDNVVYSISGEDIVTPEWGFELASGLVEIHDIVELGITTDDGPFVELLKRKDYLIGEVAANRQYVCVTNNRGWGSREWIVYNQQSKSVKRFKNTLFGYTMYVDDNHGFWAVMHEEGVKKLGEPWSDEENPPMIYYTLKDF